MSLDLPINEIKLSRGDTGLGFNIRGGIDIPHIQGDPGIFVTKLKENGAANRDGRIKEGDKLLEINGTDLRRCTHTEAVQAFLGAGNSIILKVQHGAEKYVMEQSALKNRDKPSPIPVKKSRFGFVFLLLGVLSASGIAYFVYKKYNRPTSL
ncbi:hypothetical protein SNE40_009347 [Patella caerulea]|uniref:PDZ domain-containing protein n=1 Tax=Patella caerulea TaxID=87958 RepID=A0AAN8JSE1_PATCE